MYTCMLNVYKILALKNIYIIFTVDISCHLSAFDLIFARCQSYMQLYRHILLSQRHGYNITIFIHVMFFIRFFIFITNQSLTMYKMHKTVSKKNVPYKYVERTQTINLSVIKIHCIETL